MKADNIKLTDKKETETMPDNVIPVAIFHEGCPEYLQASVNSAKRYNKRVILLGNEANRHITEEWYDCAALNMDRYEEFRKVFVNYSTYDDFFALICFRRYFLIYEFMVKMGFDRIMMAESDLYTCADFSSIPSLKHAYAMVSTVANQEVNYGWSSCCHCSYWTREAMDDFLTFCYDTFKNDKALLLEKWEYQKKNNLAGGVCDMTLAYLWSRDKANVLNSARILDGGTIDQNLCDRANYTEDDYEYNESSKIKKYIIKNEKGSRNYYLVNKQGELVKVYAIHCSGRGKASIPMFDKSYAAVCSAQKKALMKVKLGALKNKLLGKH